MVLFYTCICICWALEEPVRGDMYLESYAVQKQVQ